MTRRISQAALLCGGLGTRLGSLTQSTPKPLLPIAGVPMLQILVQEFARQGVTDFLLLAAFESEQIVRFANDIAKELSLPIKVSVSVEPERAGTGGALWFSRDVLQERFFLANADTWFDAPLASLAALLHGDPAALGAIALREVPSSDRYGTVVLSGNRISQFSEKSSKQGPSLINGGVYAFRKDILSLVAQKCSLEKDVLPRAAEQNRLLGRAADGYFIDIGIPSDYDRAQTEVPVHRRRPAVFLDRDGVLNVDHGHVGHRGRFEWIPGAKEAIASLNARGYYVFVVTNQAGIGKGKYTLDDYYTLRDHIRDELAEIGAWIDDERFCPFHPEATVPEFRSASDWRKPGPGMILDLLKHWPVDMGRSFLIGDKDSDIQAARAAGLPGHFFTGERLDRFVESVIAS